MLRILPIMLLCSFIYCGASAQTAQPTPEDIRAQVLALQTDVESIHLNLEKSKARFQRGILVATLGYTVTIAGGLMLGRENDKLGQGLLIAGGVTGVVGTYMLVDAFKWLGRTRPKPNKPF